MPAPVAVIVAVMVGLVLVVGLPRVVAAAPSLALALGCDPDEAFASGDPDAAAAADRFVLFA